MLISSIWPFYYSYYYCCACHPTMRSMTFKVDHSQAFPTYMIRKPYFVLSQAHHQVGITSRTGLLSINERSWVSYHIIEVGRLACPLLRFVGTTLGRYLGAPDLHYECLRERASRAHRRDHRCFLLLYIHTYSSNSAIFFIHKGGHFCATTSQRTPYMRKDQCSTLWPII